MSEEILYQSQRLLDVRRKEYASIKLSKQYFNYLATIEYLYHLMDYSDKDKERVREIQRLEGITSSMKREYDTRLATAKEKVSEQLENHKKLLKMTRKYQ